MSTNPTTTPDRLFFFDSHGGLWATCAPEEPEAIAFGPRGCARPAVLQSAGFDPNPNRNCTERAAIGAMAIRTEWHGEWEVLVRRPRRR